MKTSLIEISNLFISFIIKVDENSFLKFWYFLNTPGFVQKLE